MGDANALYHLGTLQMRGLGIQRDPDAALARYQSAAEKGNGAASLQLGIIYASGEEVPQDYAEAARWYYQGRRAGPARKARYNLAFLHLRGLGVRQNTPRALELLEQAARSGQRAGSLGVCTTSSPRVRMWWKTQHWRRTGCFAPQTWAARPPPVFWRRCSTGADPAAPAKERVVTLLARSASRGDAAAQANLALWYLEGRHGLHDAQLAIAMVSLALRTAGMPLRRHGSATRMPPAKG